MVRRSQPSAPDPLLVAGRVLAEAFDRFDQAVASALEIGPSDLRALWVLATGPASAGDLSVRLGLTTGSVTALIDRLVRGGFVARETPRDDRRRVIVRLDPGVADHLQRVTSSLSGPVAAAGRTLNGEHRAVVEVTLQLLADVVEARAGALPVVPAPRQASGSDPGGVGAA
jgi:DNA-binding MarR family transcriptional regulator